jgi:hypothetical protein
MKTTLALVVSCFWLLASFGAVTNAPQTLTLSWQDVSNYSATVTSMTYRVYVSTNLVNWSVLTNATVTNPPDKTAITQAISVVPGAWFFTVTASNLWGESPQSNVLALPPQASTPTGLSARLGP